MTRLIPAREAQFWQRVKELGGRPAVGSELSGAASKNLYALSAKRVTSVRHARTTSYAVPVSAERALAETQPLLPQGFGRQ